MSGAVLALTIILAALALLVLAFLGLATLWDRMTYRQLRAACDADKETPPAGWGRP